ncbi:MAG: class I SAM-dependent methyltransferase [Candidatus Helarchaeota archaeon]
MNEAELKIKELYDRSVSFSQAFYKLDAIFGRATENSIYRKRTIATLGITPGATVLDVACGTGNNFRIIEKHLQNTGKLVGVDISTESLKVAGRNVLLHGWTNVELVNNSIVKYEPGYQFDAILCTLALTIVPDYKKAIDKIHDLLKPQGRFAMLGMKLSELFPFRPFNSFIEQFYKKSSINLDRNIIGLIKSKFGKIEHYETCFFDQYYILKVKKRA